MDDSNVAQFVAITGATPDRALQYLRLSDDSIEQAVELYFATDGIDLEGPPSAAPAPTLQAPPVPPLETRPSNRSSAPRPGREIISIDSDDEISDDNDPEITGYRSRREVRADSPAGFASAVNTPPNPEQARLESEDEAMARRLQQEFYNGGNDVRSPIDADGYRAPIARTRETLVGPASYDDQDPEELQAAVEEQLRAQQRHVHHGTSGWIISTYGANGRVGIFNQYGPASIWSDRDAHTESDARRTRLPRATGASESSSKSTLLAEMYRPPFDLMSQLPWDRARSEGRDKEKWMLVNIQDPAVFECQVLNRDLWKNQGIKDTVKEHFLFLQYGKDDPRGAQYVQYYFPSRHDDGAYPHIAIVDPRTGEQVKVWSGPPAPPAADFLMQLHEFLDRYSLNAAAKNPVARRKAERSAGRTVEAMTEEEMMAAAVRNSLAGGGDGGGGVGPEDPDDLTRSTGYLDKGKEKVEASHTNGHAPSSSFSAEASSRLAGISSDKPHTEPAADAPDTTRIQFRHAEGRVVRRFALADPVRRIYEWLKASPLPGHEGGGGFELVSMGRNLMEVLDLTVGEAGLRNGTVMVEVAG